MLRITVQYRSLLFYSVRKDGKSCCLKTDNIFLSEGDGIFNYTSKNPLVIMSNGKIIPAPEDLFWNTQTIVGSTLRI